MDKKIVRRAIKIAVGKTTRALVPWVVILYILWLCTTVINLVYWSSH